MEKLREFLKQRNLTQRDLAERMGISEEYLSRMITGKHSVTESFIGRFFRAFGPEDTQTVFGTVVTPVVIEEA